MRGAWFQSFDFFFLSLFFFHSCTMERKKSDTSLCFAEFTLQAIIQHPRVGATRVLFSRGKYTHPSIILFLTVFHYCLRKKGSNAPTLNKSHLRRPITFKAKFTRFPAVICRLHILSGRNKKSLHYTFVGSTSLKKKKNKKENKQVISTILEFGVLIMEQSG